MDKLLKLDKTGDSILLEEIKKSLMIVFPELFIRES